MIISKAFRVMFCAAGVLSPTRKETSYGDRRFWVSYL